MTLIRKKSTIISDKTVKPKSKKQDHYVDNEALLEALIKRKLTPSRKLDNFVGEQLMEISKNLSNKYQFRNYPFVEEMIADGALNCWKYVDNFDPEKTSNPFAYFTQVCYYAFIERIKIEKKSLYVKFKASSEALANGEVADLAHGSSEITEAIVKNLDVPQEYLESYIAEYEEKNKMKKARDIKKDTSEEEKPQSDFF